MGCGLNAQGLWVVLKSRQSAGVKNNGIVLSKLRRHRYEILSVGESAKALHPYLEEGQMVLVNRDNTITLDDIIACKVNDIVCVVYEDE